MHQRGNRELPWRAPAETTGSHFQEIGQSGSYTLAAKQKMRAPDSGPFVCCSQGNVFSDYCGGWVVLPVFPVPVPLGLPLGDAPMLPELPFSLPLQVSETISTLATLKVFSDPDALPDDELGDI